MLESLYAWIGRLTLVGLAISIGYLGGRGVYADIAVETVVVAVTCSQEQCLGYPTTLDEPLRDGQTILIRRDVRVCRYQTLEREPILQRYFLDSWWPHEGTMPVPYRIDAAELERYVRRLHPTLGPLPESRGDCPLLAVRGGK